MLFNVFTSIYNINMKMYLRLNWNDYIMNVISFDSTLILIPSSHSNTNKHTVSKYAHISIILFILRTTEFSSFQCDISIIKWLKWEETKTPRDFFSKINTTRSKPKSNRIFLNFYIFFWRQKTNNATAIELSSSIIWL